MAIRNSSSVQPNVRLAAISAIALGLEGVAWFVVGGFASIVLIMIGLAVFWIGLKRYVVPKDRSG